MAIPERPNEPGKWTLVASDDGKALWRRERSDPVWVTMFYIFAPPLQARILYNETQALLRFEGVGV